MSAGFQNTSARAPFSGNSQGLRTDTWTTQGRRISSSGSTAQMYNNSSMMATGLPASSSQAQASSWQPQEVAQSSVSPTMQSPSMQMATEEVPHHLSPRSSQRIERKPMSPSSSPEARFRSPSYPNPPKQQTAELQHESQQGCEQCERTQGACDSMLTELMDTQEQLEERDKELKSLREQLARHQSSPIMAQQADTVYAAPVNNAQLEAELQTQRQQLQGWSKAYNSLKASHDDLQRRSSQQSAAIGAENSRVQNSEAQQALESAQKMCDFLKQNSANVAKENLRLTEQWRSLEARLEEKTIECQDQKRMLEGLAVR